jgi:hypothetical protein
MSEEPELRVEIHRIGPTRRGGRGPGFVWAFVAVLVAVVGLAVAGGGSSDGEPAPSDAAVAPTEANPTPARTRRPTPAPTPPAVLPDLPNESLAGAPMLVIGKQAGVDLELEAWWPGEPEFSDLGRIPGVMATLSAVDSYTSVDLAPMSSNDGELPHAAAVAVAHRQDGTVTSRARLAGSDGILWEGDETPYVLQTVWSGDGSALAVGGAPVWTIVQIEPDGSVATVTARVADDPQPVPSGSPPIDPYAQRFPQPIAFSADGRWLYGAVYRDAQPTVRAAVRVDLAADPPLAEAIDRFPAGPGPDRLAPTNYFADLIDPLTGRMAEVSYDGATPRLIVYERDGSRAAEPFGRDLGVQAATWLDTGELLVTTFRPLSPVGDLGSVEVLRVNLDAPGDADYLLGTERINGAWTAGTRAGFALVTFWADAEAAFVMLRISDGGTGAIRLRQPEFMSLDLVDR